MGIIVGTLAGAAALAVMGVFLWRRRTTKKKNDGPPPVPHLTVGDNLEHGGDHGQDRGVSFPSSTMFIGGNRTDGLPSQRSSSHTYAMNRHERDTPPPPYQHTEEVAAGTEIDDCKRANMLPTAPQDIGAVQRSTKQTTHPDGGRAIAGGGAKNGKAAEPLLSTAATNSTANLSTHERGEVAAMAFNPGDDPVASDSGAPSTASSRRTSSGVGYSQAVVAAAQELAQHCQIPGVSEAATVVSILVRLVSDHQDDLGRGDAKVKRCRSIVMMLERAAKVLGKVGRTAFLMLLFVSASYIASLQS